MSGPLVLKFGGELLEDAARLHIVVGAIARLAARRVPLVVVHGGGKEIDAALKVAGIEKRQVEGLRITDDRTLEVVVSVLAGTINTRFVAALTTAGVHAVGLTGADAANGVVAPAPPHRTVDGELVDLGRVGIPSEMADVRVVALLAREGFVPVVACIGLGADGRLYNVNADTCASHLAARLGARRLVIAGTTAGVLDGEGRTLAELTPAAMEALIAGGTATAGMIAKLRECQYALAHGVTDVTIVDGRDGEALEAAAVEEGPRKATRLIHAGAMQGGLTMATVMDDVQALEAQRVLQTYKRQPITLVRGQGVRLYDAEGREYIDLLSGIGVASLGHAHPGLARAIADQAQTLIHTSNLYFHPLQGQLAAKLCEMSGLPRAFFCNSGAEAVEACLKFARRYWYTQGEARPEIVALTESFHGRTFGALSVTSDEHYRTPFAPLLANVTFVEVNDAAALTKAVTRQTAAIIAEPIQGEGGVRPLTPAFAAAIEEACERTGALLIADEVQSGLGRTGVPFYYQTLGLTPDLVSVGKALGSGVPIGAALISDAVAAKISYGDHGTTYGGNLLACRAALYFLGELIDGGVMAHVATVGRHFEERLRAIKATHPFVKEIRGAGLIWGLDLDREATAVVPAGIARGVIVNRTADTVVRLLPPLVITEAELDEGLNRLDVALGDFARNGGQPA